MTGVGIDFGTTNSAIARSAEGGEVTLARFPHREGVSDTFRSVLYFHPELRDAKNRLQAIAGARAIERYLDADGSGRLIQSLKSYLSDRSFESTSIFSRAHSLVDLLAILIRDLAARAVEHVGALSGPIVVGRPVHFSGADTEAEDAFAEGRLRAALAAAGFDEVSFEYEPVAAARYYESRLDHDEVVLVADFGGGTSDFSILSVGPKARRAGRRTVLGNDGVGIAGDALDAKILHHVVAPALGMGTTYRSVFDQVLPVPVWLYFKLRRWHHLSFLKTRKTMELLAEIHDRTEVPEKIRDFIHVIESDLGYHLYRAVERAKVELSSKDVTRFVFKDAPVEIERAVSRVDFEGWIAEETGAMAACVDRLLARVGAAPGDIDQVFMTGGTSFVPAVRRIFDERFGAAKIRAGGEMISVATGLALCAQGP